MKSHKVLIITLLLIIACNQKNDHINIEAYSLLTEYSNNLNEKIEHEISIILNKLKDDNSVQSESIREDLIELNVITNKFIFASDSMNLVKDDFSELIKNYHNGVDQFKSISEKYNLTDDIKFNYEILADDPGKREIILIVMKADLVLLKDKVFQQIAKSIAIDN